jgi:hypothetical protein
MQLSLPQFDRLRGCLKSFICAIVGDESPKPSFLEGLGDSELSESDRLASIASQSDRNAPESNYRNKWY